MLEKNFGEEPDYEDTRRDANTHPHKPPDIEGLPIFRWCLAVGFLVGESFPAKVRRIMSSEIVLSQSVCRTEGVSTGKLRMAKPCGTLAAFAVVGVFGRHD